MGRVKRGHGDGNGVLDAGRPTDPGHQTALLIWSQPTRLGGMPFKAAKASEKSEIFHEFSFA